MQHVPNLLSLSRIASTLLIFILVLLNQHWAFFVATVFFVLASITDLLDGYLARRYHLVSSLGVFLDLTADKVFVSSILIALVQIGLVPAWIVVIIVAREFLVTGLRSMVAAQGTVIAAGRWGKQKTFITLLAIGGILLAHGLGDPRLALFPTPVLTPSPVAWSPSSLLHLLADIALVLATFWTIMSGVEYVLRALPLLQGKKDHLRA
ncbi:CDP-diacylglycerol--glycerol-3-phosphate 3-phosphatidyltransferase [Thermogemmatispora tikiterensis]|uniref:CDP-diacylglycerol--glycerol-3-phosphate 3-phosphatidyltransferase n=1 Tax=Thermogemmatispora tikiterensis TaxID=1825093 RepID=A0A328VNS1_9CHLR|nr:CDP-diacylglycerol--glycerol-3-phosphate 3-phosphatidyltransferase [Thermogemmatispora tikiterensis]RAQ97430.1 CDP-diacylglycerol--glycerol-3-phosphate 3-phosphatidyltransferase [Thermogemmatispora tikiterensis]